MRKIIIFFIIIGFCFIVNTSYAYRVSYRGWPAKRDYVPTPRLISPKSEIVNLSDKDELLFKWSPHEARRFGKKYYDFRLYKGYNMVEANLILKEQAPGNERSFFVKSEVFNDREIYTWSLRLVYPGKGKSSRSFHSFKVLK